MFKPLGLLLVGYVVYALTTGRIFAKSGAWGKTCSRDESPASYWSAVIAYACLAAMLVLWF